MSRASWARARARAKQELLDADIELLQKAGCYGHAQFLIEERLIKKLEKEHANEIESTKSRHARCC